MQTTITPLSPFTITVGGETFDVPTYAVSEQEIPDLLAMEEGAVDEFDGIVVQRGSGMHFMRWFCFSEEKCFSLRLVK